jgi:hypothetical protein
LPREDPWRDRLRKGERASHSSGEETPAHLGVALEHEVRGTSNREARPARLMSACPPVAAQKQTSREFREGPIVLPVHAVIGPARNIPMGRRIVIAFKATMERKVRHALETEALRP